MALKARLNKGLLTVENIRLQEDRAFFQEGTMMRHRYQLDGMGVERGFVRRAFANQVVVNAEVRG